MSFNSQEYIELFFQDAEEHLEAMTDALLNLEKNPSDVEAVGAIFRAAHTIKSSSAMVGFMQISEFTHKLEDLIGYYRDQGVSMSSVVVNTIFEAFDVLKDMMSQAQNSASENDVEQTNQIAKDLIHTFQEILQSVTSGEPEPDTNVKINRIEKDGPTKQLETQDQNGSRRGTEYVISVQLDPECVLTTVRAFMILSNLEKVGGIIKTEPEMDLLQENLGHHLKFTISTTHPKEAIENAVMVGEVKEFNIQESTENQSQVPIPIQSSIVTIESNLVAVNTAKFTENSSTNQIANKEDTSKSDTVRVNIEKLDQLMNLMAEMIIQRSQTFEIAQQIKHKANSNKDIDELLEGVIKQGKLLNQLQDTVMGTRMLPIGTVFSRFKRLVRDLSQKQNKQVNFVIEGEETELDKKIIDALGDPLTHMIRNSLDHGIEPPDVRKQLGKSAAGMLHLKAVHKGNNIVIEIQDDGKGIDPEIIKKKAIEKGTITKEEALSLSKKEIINLIFAPGFSTAQQVTDLSGRGVGMDVVRRTIEKIGGSVEIESVVGKGSRFCLNVPLTMAIMQSLLVRSDRNIYAIPISSVSEIIKLKTYDVFTVQEKNKVIRLRDHIVPLVQLSTLLDHSSSGTNQNDQYIVIVNHNNHLTGILVDELFGEREVVIKPLNSDYKSSTYISGASILGDGRVILILDLSALSFAQETTAA